MATATTRSASISRRLLRWLAAEFNAYLSLGVSSLRRETTIQDAEQLLSDVDQVLDKGSFDTKFSTAITQRFEQSSKKARAALFVRLAFVGIIIYDLFLFVDALIVPDVMRVALLVQLGFATPIALGMMIASRRLKVDTDAAGAVIIAAMSAGAIAMFAMSRSAHVVLFPAVFTLFLLSANVAQALFFKWAAAFSLLFTAAASFVIFGHPSLDVETKIFWIVVLVSAMHYSLAGNYRINAGVRRAYLFALRESLRAQLLVESNAELVSMVGIDSLTTIGNRRHFDQSLDNVWRDRQANPIAVLLIDIDHFKRLNDTLGHQGGDECLRKVAQTLAGVVGDLGVTTRYGGEEFAVILPGADGQGAFSMAERLRRTVERLDFDCNTTRSLNITVSIGCATSDDDTIVSASDLVAAADWALYAAKHSGRNRTRFAASDDITVPKLERGNNGDGRLLAG